MVYLLEWIGAISIIVIAAFVTTVIIFTIKEAVVEIVLDGIQKLENVVTTVIPDEWG